MRRMFKTKVIRIRTKMNFKGLADHKRIDKMTR